MTLPVIELRQYTLHPGRRDELVALFEREFIESQEALGMKVMGTFRDLDRPDRFVWIRGFADMPSRAEALNAFYDGPVWQEHRDAANATMIDFDDVLLLRPLRADSGFAPLGRGRPAAGAAKNPEGLIVAHICSLANPPGPEIVDFVGDVVEPGLKAAGFRALASYITETSPNDYPRLPVREGEHVFVWFSGFRDPAAYDRATASQEWRAVEEALLRRFHGMSVLRLQPTPQSELRP